MRVQELMTRNPITIDRDAPLATAMAVMKKAGIRHLLVTDEAGRLAGIITDRDLRSAVFAPALIEPLSGRAERRAQELGKTLEELHVRDAAMRRVYSSSRVSAACRWSTARNSWRSLS